MDRMAPKLDESRGKSLICIFVAILVAICVFSILISMSQIGCELQNDIPEIRHSNEPMISADFKLLAWFSGYLKYLEPMNEKSNNRSQAIYMPLELRTVRLLLDPNSPEKQIRFSAECAKLTLFLRDNPSQKTVSIVESYLNLTVPIDGNHQCFLEGLNISYSSDKHYSCQHERIYPCRVPKTVGSNRRAKPVVSLVVQSLEFEVDEANQEKVKSRSYITAPSFCNTSTHSREYIIDTLNLVPGQLDGMGTRTTTGSQLEP